jgi:hypothetical protein
MNRKICAVSTCILLSVTSMMSQTVGNDKDEHGCLASAGYTYSAIKKDCIRVFEQEIQLSEVNPDGTSTSISAVIFSDDKKQAEVFIPDSKSGIILTRRGKDGSYCWKKGKLCLLQKDKKYILKKSKKIIYSSDAV